ncbi:MAG: OadG family protein [Saprospiraceae bacterium]|nr:OadG family protein [Saprospiraceae bacterium]
MKPELVEAFGILLVGMITVFTVLALIVASGRVLIWAVNRTVKEIPSIKKSTIQKSTLQGEMNPQKMAAIVAAVEIVTNGKGKITSIEKV